MAETIAIGAQSFEYLREYGYFFVDKSEFIKEWWENGDVVTLITRPRRFGKTLNLNMLECFFSNRYSGHSNLFEGLKIWEDGKYRQLQGTYPVISLSFANIKNTNSEDAKRSIKRTIAQLYDEHLYIRNDKQLSERNRRYFDSIGPDMPDDEAEAALQYLSQFVSRYYGKKVLIFLDEYDTPMQEAYINGYWDEMVDFIRNLFNSTFKTNPFMERSLMTGITRVSKESIFSDLNNLAIITTTSEMYSTKFGFTEEEVFEALDKFGLSDAKNKVKEWYDGFTFGKHRDIYNPWSITGFLKEGEYKPYWANTSSNSLVGKLIREGTPETKIIMEDLLQGKCLETEIDEEIVFDQLTKNKMAIWSLLLAGGYLKIEDRIFSEQTDAFIYRLGITNREVRFTFRKMIHSWFTDEKIPYNDFIKAFLSDDIEYMNHFMNKIAMASFSYFDTGKEPSDDAEPERFYHGFVLGLMVDLAGQYHISSNRESGFGRYDVILEPLDKRSNAMVLEFKVFNSRKEKNLEDTVKNALLQIEEKKYDQELLSRGISKDNIRHYGFAFEGKRVLIG